jgi:hypothetical protein
MKMRVMNLLLIATVSAVACSSAPSNGGGGNGEPGSSGGTGGRASGTGGRSGTGGSPSSGGGSGGSSGAGGSTGSGGASSTGGSTGSGGNASGGTTGSGGSVGTPDAAAPDTSAPDMGGTTPPPPGPGDSSQGPVALGKIVYSQDFENGMAGITLSPANLPPERVAIVADPLGKRGKVISVTWKSGDNFRTSAGTQPRSWISNAKEGGYQVTPGTKVSYAWGQMWPDINMDAFFAQNIGPGPVWELRVRADGTFNVLCNKCGGNQEFMKLQPNRWYDFRVDMDWQDGGTVKFFIDGQMVRQSTVSGVGGANCHWDGGIYNTAGGTASNKTRTTFISNLSVGER